MEKIGAQIQSARKAANLSQFDLAMKAQVSLATIQNLEAGRANPALGTLQSILAVLRLEMSIQPAAINWREVLALGVPLMGTVERKVPPDAKDIIQTLESQAVQIAALKEDSRELRALGSWLWALHDHYPSLWARIPDSVQTWFSEVPEEFLSIKLRRISLAALSEGL